MSICSYSKSVIAKQCLGDWNTEERKKWLAITMGIFRGFICSISPPPIKAWWLLSPKNVHKFNGKPPKLPSPFSLVEFLEITMMFGDCFEPCLWAGLPWAMFHQGVESVAPVQMPYPGNNSCLVWTNQSNIVSWSWWLTLKNEKKNGERQLRESTDEPFVIRWLRCCLTMLSPGASTRLQANDAYCIFT